MDEANGPSSNCVECVCRDTLPWLISFSLDLMLRRVLVITFLLGVAVAARAETTSADLVGEWSSGRPSHADWRLFTFRADHSWNGIADDIDAAGKWKLHGGKKLELIYYSDGSIPRKISGSESNSRVPLSQSRVVTRALTLSYRI